MKIVKTISEVRAAVKAWRAEGLSVGLVPTMGFLHEGHKSLIDRAVKENDRVVVSDFVNPTQFGPTEDLASYPRDLERDATLCENAGAALLFNPEPSEMYAEDACTFVDMSGLTGELCGKSRPIHFRGVCTVVSKLFHIVAPDRAYFGQKDAQQLSVIRRMVRDLNFDIEIIGCPIVREADGLAKSSRNTYLNAEERKAALVLSQAVKLGQKLAADGDRNCTWRFYREPGFRYTVADLAEFRRNLWTDRAGCPQFRNSCYYLRSYNQNHDGEYCRSDYCSHYISSGLKLRQRG